MSSGKLKIALFGSLEITNEEGALISLPTRKAEALLAYLLERDGETVSRETLSSLLWPYSGPEQARASLRQEFSVLRKALGPEYAAALVTQGDRVGFAQSLVDVDLWRFRRWTQGGNQSSNDTLALYRGPFLDTFRIGSQAFSDWVWLTRQALEAEAIKHGAASLERAIAQGNSAEIQDIAKHLSRVDPTFEPAHRALIEYYLSKNYVHLARRQAELCQNILETQLDAAPSSQTQALIARIGTHTSKQAPPKILTGQKFQQRRLVTVLSILGGLDTSDPEEFEDAARDFAQTVEGIVTSKGGAMLQVFNDRVSAVFGYPVTHDGDADCAILSALELFDATANAQWDPLTCRIGVAQGVALITANEGRHGPPLDVTGPVVRDAESCALASAQGQVLVDAAMNVQKSPHFKLAASGAPSGAQRAIRPAPDVNEQNQTTLFAKRNHPTIGRDRQTAQARTGLDRALQGLGAAIAIQGNPGEGKSRLVQDVAETAEHEGFEIKLFQGMHFSSQSAFAPVIDHIRRTSDFDPNGDETHKAFLKRWLVQRAPDLLPASGYFASLLSGTEIIEDDQGLSMSQAKDLALDYFVAGAKASSPQAPRLLIFEDMHWFDPTSCEAVARLIETLEGTSTCALFVARTTEVPTVLNHPFVQQIELQALDPVNAESLLRQLVKSTFLSKTTVTNVLERAEGNPLIIEEFAKVLDLSESGSNAPLGTAFDMARPDDAIHATALPDQLLPSLLVRIDTVPGAIQILQNASVLGRSFTLAHLASLMGPMAVPRTVLDELQDKGIIVASRREALKVYSFKHALISEAIYSTIPIRSRKTLHGAAARALLSDTTENNDSEIARHYKAAEVYHDAATYFERVGDKAVRIAASAEAIFQFSQALEMVKQTPSSDSRMRRELSLNRKIAAQFIGLHGIPTSAAQPYYHAATELSLQLGDKEEIVNVAWGLWSNQLMIAQLDACLATAQDTHDSLDQDTPVVTGLIVAYMLGVTHAYRGTLDEATRYLQMVGELFTEDMTHELQSRFGMDISLTADSFLGWVHALNGEAELANIVSERALARSGRDNLSLSSVFAHIFAATKCLFLDQLDAAQTYASHALVGAQQMQFKQWAAQARIQLARVADLNGETDALARLQDGMSDYLETGMVLARPYAQVWIAEAMIRRNQTDQALSVLEDLQDFTRASNECYFNDRAEEARTLANAAKLGDGI